MAYDIGEYEIGEEELVGYEDDYDEFDVGEDELEELLADDDDDEVGFRIPFSFKRGRKRSRGRGRVVRRRRAPMVRRVPIQAMSRAIANRKVRSMALLKESVPDKPRQFPLGFDSVTTVAAAAQTTITSRPQVLFRPERLVLSSAAAPAFLVNDLIVGKNSQFAASGSLPGDAFGPTAFGVRLRCDTAQVANDVVLDITNISAGALRFTAALFGDVIES